MSEPTPADRHLALGPAGYVPVKTMADRFMDMISSKAPQQYAPPSPPSPRLLGTGLARTAGDALATRKSKIDKAIKDAVGG